MLRDEVEEFNRLSGEDGMNTSVARVAGFLDGYHKALEDRPKGVWIPKLHASENDIFVCSHCKRESGYDPKYCPHCGAQMTQYIDDSKLPFEI